MASDLIKLLKRLVCGLVISNIILVIAIVFVVRGFLHYLSLYDFTNTVDQNIENVDNATVNQRNGK